VNRFRTAGGNGDSIPVELSADGRYALFESFASDLVAGDNNNCADIFLRDLVAGTTALVSVSTSGGAANGASRGSVVTPDGRFVAFVSAASNLVAADTNGIPDVFVRDTQLGTMVLASPGAAASSAVSSCESPVITPDGRYVVFYSTATNLVPGVTNISEIYLRDIVGSQTFLASTNARSIALPIIDATTLASYGHSVSDDGAYVVYQTGRANPIAVGRAVNFRYNVLSNRTDIVRSNAVATVGFENARNLDTTPDGRFVVFVASSSGTSGANGCVYRWDGLSNTTDLVSADLSSSAPTGAICEWPVVDPSGRYIAFLSTATNLTGDTLTSDYNLYVRDMQAHTTKLVNVDSLGNSTVLNPVSYPCISTNGRLIAFECQDSSLVPNDNNRSYDVFVRDLAAGTNELISTHHPSLPSLSAAGPSAISLFAFSTNGQFLAFSSRGSNLTPDDTNSFRNVFVRDLVAGTNFLVSVNSTGAVPATGSSYEAAISGDGRYVAFTSRAGDIFTGDNNGVSDVFVRDVQGGTSVLASVSMSPALAGNSGSSSPVLSGDGHYVLFHSKATDLSPGIGTSADNIYLRDLQAGTTRALTTNSASGGSAAAMTPDGHFVALTLLTAAGVFVYDTPLGQRVYSSSVSSASSIGISAGGSRLAFATSSQLWVADRVANTTTLIGSGLGTTRPGLRFSADGRFLVYATTNAVVAKDTNQLADVYLYDFQSGTNLLVSRSFDTGAAGNGASDSPDISLDGRFVAYRSRASDLVPGDGNAVSDIYLFDRMLNTTTVISANPVSGAIGNARSLNPVFSADGQSLAFASWAGNLVSLDHNQASDVFVLGLAPPAFVDSDGDGMDDAWEMQYFGTLARNGTGDFDGDGVSDLVEFQTGTDPTDPMSYFHATVVSTGPSHGTIISWPAVPGRTYHVQFKSNLSDSNWQDLGASIVFVGKRGYANDTSTVINQRFYRVVLNNS
jgi:dipeptidyl aminopeptidase/acylaminoacyl peptidase